MEVGEYVYITLGLGK